MVLILASQNQKKTNRGGLAKLLHWRKNINSYNIGIEDRLINGQIGNIRHFEFAQGSVCKVYVKFSDKQACLKAMRSSYLGRQNSWVPIEKCETEKDQYLHQAYSISFNIIMGIYYHKNHYIR